MPQLPLCKQRWLQRLNQISTWGPQGQPCMSEHPRGCSHQGPSRLGQLRPVQPQGCALSPTEHRLPSSSSGLDWSGRLTAGCPGGKDVRERLEILGAKASSCMADHQDLQQACPHPSPPQLVHTHTPSSLESYSQLCQFQGPIQNPVRAANKALNQGSYQHTYWGPSCCQIL